MRRRRRGKVLAAAVTIGVLTACSGTSNNTKLQQVRSSHAVVAGVDYAKHHLLDVENTPSLMVFDYLSRNWDLPGLKGAKVLALQRLRRGRTNSTPGLFRLVRADYPMPARFNDPASGTDSLIARVLYCEQKPLPADFSNVMLHVAQAGGYETTHALLAAMYVRELKCPMPGLDDVIQQEVAEVAQHLSQETAVNDRHMEESAVLAYAGAADKVPKGWIDQVKKAQRADGGWGIDGPSEPSNWHATVVALWAILANATPGEGVPFVVGAPQ